MISLKDYAKQNHVTYEAVRKQVARYKNELDDHIIQDGRTQYLDDVAVAFLDERRQKNPVVVYQQGKDETIEQLRLEKEQLLMKLATQSEAMVGLLQYKLDAEENRRALEDAQTAQERRDRELDAREQEMDQRLTEARQEAAEAAQKAAEEKAAQELDQEKQRHQEELTAAQGRERELREYLTALEAWNALSSWKRRKKKKYPRPAAPEWLKEE